MLPNTVVKKETFNPEAIILALISFMEPIASKAVIIPIKEPKNPMTNPRILVSEASILILIDLELSFFSWIKPSVRKISDSTRQIRIKDINKDPPSLNLSTNTFENNTTVLNKVCMR